jgi:outer membrane usher protein
MTVTNALGQQVTLTQPFYASSAMLAPGLQTFAMQTGLVRRDWGAVSNDYGKMAGAAIYRRGLTRKFTVEGSVEDTPGAFMAGVGGVAQIGNLGVVNFAVAPSFGSRAAPARSFRGRPAYRQGVQPGRLRDCSRSQLPGCGVMNGAGVPRKQLSGFTSLSLKRFGSGHSLRRDRPGCFSRPAPAKCCVGPALPGCLCQLFDPDSPRLDLRHRVSRPREQRQQRAAGWLDHPIRQAKLVSVGVASDGSGQVQVQQPAPMVGDWGYQAYLSAGDSTHAFAQGQYKSPRACLRPASTATTA